MSRRLFHGQLSDEIAGDDRLRAERLRLLARSLVDIVRDALVRDGVVRIHGFGTFRLARMAPRRGVNPRTGETIDIPARNRVIFRPAKALRERIEPDHPAAVPLAEPHESREAWLGGAMADSPVAGGLPAAEDRGTQRNYFPDRVAAAAMAEPTARLTASAHPLTPRASGSREANLGGAMGDTPSAGRVITGDDNGASVSAAPASGRAANDEAEPPSSADATATPARERHPAEEPPAPGPAPAPGPEIRHADETDVPVLTEPVAGATADEGDTGEPRDRGRPAGALVAGLILLLLVLLLGWWLWPRGEPAPVATPDPGAGVEESDTAATGATEAAGEGAEATAAVPVEEAEQAVAEEEPGQASGAETAVTAADESEGESAGASVVSGETEAEGAPVATATPEPEPEEGEAAASVAEAAPAADAEAGEMPAEASVGIADYAAGEDAPVADTASPTSTAEETAAELPEEAPAADSPWFAGREYTVVRGDTLWDLSDRNYVNPFYWPHIWNHNESIADPDRIEIDQALWLPRLEGEPRSLTQADRRSIAEGYLRLYHLWQDTGAGNPQYALVGVRYFDPSVMPPDLRNDPSAGRPNDALAAAFEALLEAEFPRN